MLKEFIQFIRDWLITVFILTLPVLQLGLLAHTTGSGVTDLGVAVLDLDHSSLSRQLVTALDNRRELDIRRYPTSLTEIHHLLDQGEVTLAVIIPAGFAADLTNPVQLPDAQLIADASNSIPGRVALSAARAAVVALDASTAEQVHEILEQQMAEVIDLNLIEVGRLPGT